jgi:hypothetical protein
VGIPMVFMVGMTLTATIMLSFSGSTALPVRTVSAFLLVLGIMMVVEAVRSLGKPNVEPEEVILRSDLGSRVMAAGD